MALPLVGSPITEIHIVRPKQKLQNDTESPNTKIASHHPPKLTHKKIVSCCPSIRLSTLSINTAKQASAPIW
jgi:hypothetical protein